MKVLITSGGTREAIDAARFITNMSTGRTGRVIAETLGERGCEVLCLCAAGAERPAGGNVRAKSFSSFGDLDEALKAALAAENFDAVVHLAAVSDYSPALIEADGKEFLPGLDAKLDSAPQEIKLTLKRNHKIIDRIKSYSAAAGRPEPLLIGFKLTSGAGAAKVKEKVLALTAADLVVHNDLEEMRRAHIFRLYTGGVLTGRCTGPKELALKLFDFISSRTEALCY
jgi:phosphopantothenoylcysteine decarboxylase/phosphopantothenate--cysteine ligase